MEIENWRQEKNRLQLIFEWVIQESEYVGMAVDTISLVLMRLNPGSGIERKV
jgi:hypothetical protein